MAGNNYFVNAYKKNANKQNVEKTSDDSVIIDSSKENVEKINKHDIFVNEFKPQKISSTVKANNDQIKNEKLNNDNPKDDKPRVVKPFVFEKVPTSMPPQDEIKPKEISKAKLSAIFLVLSGVDKAAKIAASFNDEELDKLSYEILKIKSVSKEEFDAVEKQFGAVKVNNLAAVSGGKEFVRQLYQILFGLANGSDKFVKIVDKADKDEVKYIAKLSPEQIITLLSSESDLIFTSVLPYLTSQTAAGAIKLLPPARAVSVIRMLSSKTAMHSDILQTVLSKLNEKSKNMLVNEEYKIQGTNRLIDIIKNSDTKVTDNIISAIMMSDPELADKLKDSIFTFNDVIAMPKKSLELVLKNYENKDIAFILKGTDEAVKTVFLTCVTKRRKELIMNEIEILGQVKKIDVDEKRKEFVDYIRKLEDEGTIVTKEDDDEIYVN